MAEQGSTQDREEFGNNQDFHAACDPRLSTDQPGSFEGEHHLMDGWWADAKVALQNRPRLEDGTPFPTLYYLTCSRLCSRVGGLEASGTMREMTERLASDDELAAAYQRAHLAYVAERDAIEPLGTQISAGGMPNRVKCLHALVAHALAVGPGVNPFGDETLAAVGDWWRSGPCVHV